MQNYGENPFEAGEDSIQMSQQKMSFFDEVDSLKRLLLQYEDQIERIEGLQKRTLSESRQSELETLERQVQAVENETRGLANSLRDRIKTLESESMSDYTKHAQAENLKRQFMTLIQKFQNTEAAFRQRYQEVAERQYRIVAPDATDEEVRMALEDGQGEVFSQALMQSNRRGEARAALTEVQTRHREIQRIEATMTELAQLFHDMEIMVAEQEQQIAEVEQNVYHAEQDIERGVDNQYQAIKKARNARRMKWACFGIILAIIIILALVLGIYFGTHH